MNWQPNWTTKERFIDIKNFEGETWLPIIAIRGVAVRSWYWISNLGRLRRKNVSYVAHYKSGKIGHYELPAKFFAEHLTLHLNMFQQIYQYQTEMA